MKSLNGLQAEIAAWRTKNFPDSGAIEQYMGIIEELGELSHELLKDRQGIRDASEEKAMDAMGDMLIFAMNFCSCMGWSFEEILYGTWEGVVNKRDWVKFPKNGVTE
jgi:NTP pyrophosphatase (non-canonical NTP hydrolase)